MSTTEIKEKQNSLARRIRKEGMIRTLNNLSNTSFTQDELNQLNEAQLFVGSVPNVEFIHNLVCQPRLTPSIESRIMAV